MKVRLTSTGAEGWSLEVELQRGATVRELKETLAGAPHLLELGASSKLLARLATGLLVTVPDSAGVKKEMVVHGMPPQGRDAVDSRGPGAGLALETPSDVVSCGLSWIADARHLPWARCAAAPDRGLDRVRAAMLLDDALEQIAHEPVQQRLDLLFARCPQGECQLQPGPSGLPRLHELVRLVSGLLAEALAPMLERWRGKLSEGLQGLLDMHRLVQPHAEHEEVAARLEQLQQSVWTGGAEAEEAQAGRRGGPRRRRQALLAMPCTLFLAYAFHWALPPLERRLSSGARAIAFLEALLREHGRGLGAMWPRSRHGRPRPLVVWVLGGSEACEGRLARAGYFEDAAGLLGQGWPVMCMDLVFVGTRRWEGLPCGRRARASSVVEPLAEGAPPPDLAVLLNPGLGELDEAGARALDSLLPQIGPLLDGSVCSEGGGAPCVATTSRCEEVAVGERALFERLGASIVLGPVRNLFSGAAAAPAARYDDNGWAVVARGRGGTPRPGSGAEVAGGAADLRRGLPQEAAARAAPGGGHSAGEGLRPPRRGPMVFWGILDLKFDPALPVEERVKVLETGDGRASKFSGHGAAIKESLRLSAARGDCAGDEPGEAPQRAMLVENKRLTHDAFRDGGYEHLLPRQLCLPRVYTAALAREIVEGLHLGWRDACVLKLCNRARGAGCVPLRCSELDEALRLLLSPPDSTQEWLREQHPRFSRACSWGCFEEQLRHWWSNECPVFVAEPCHRSVLTEKDGRGFDGTLRLGFALHRTEGAEGGDELEVMTENGPWRGRRARQASLDLAGRPGERALSSTEMRRWFGAQESGALVLEWLGGYWKLPEEDVTSPDLRGRVVSKARQGTAPVSGAHLHEVYAAVGDAVENAFGASGMGVQQLRQRYPEARELCAFLTARLACTVRGREPGRGRMLLKLADEYNSRGSGWPQRYVKSYIERSLGIFEALRGRWDEADGCFERSLAAMPTNATAKYLRGMSSLEAGDFRAAVSWMEACLQLDPDFKAPYVNIAVAHLSLRDWESAAEASQAGLGRHPGTPQCLYNLGLALFWTALEAEEAGHFSPHPLRQGALDSLQAARDCLEKRAAQWTEADDKLLWELRFRESTMHRPLKWGGWKYYAWRP